MKDYTNALFGNSTFKKEIEICCGKSMLYRHCGTKPNNLIIQLDRGEGRTAVMEYAISIFKDYSTLDFSSGRDDYIECDFDGTLLNYKKCMAQIDAAAEYVNRYKGGISVDCSHIANHYTEKHYEDFINRFSEICDSAWVVFFFSSSPSRNEDKLIEKLRKKIKFITFLDYEPYTEKDLANIFLCQLSSLGVSITPNHKTLTSIIELFETTAVSSVKQLNDLAIMILDYVAYDDNPILTTESIDKFSKELRKDATAK